MANYGLTDNGFVIKRLDTILNEIHEELSDGFGIDTRISKPSFLDVLVTTFAGQIANLWEVAHHLLQVYILIIPYNMVV